MNIELISSMVVGLFIYNILLKAIGKAIIDAFMKTDVAQKEKKSFNERLAEKQNEINK